MFELSTTAGQLAPGVHTVQAGAQDSSSLTISGGLSGETVATVSVVGESTGEVKATLTVDDVPPEVSNLAGAYERKGKNHRIQLSWDGSDASGIASYEIIRDNSPITTTSQSSYTDSLPGSPAASYAYQVRAFDIHDNEALSSTITVLTGGSDDGDGGGGSDKPCRGKKCTN